MSLISATQVTAVATVVLAAFAIVTAAFAILAFRKQSDAVNDGRRLIGQQKDMLQVQAGRLEDQRKVNVRQIEVLELQAIELRDSTAVRKRAQAARVYVKQEPERTPADIDRLPRPGGPGPRVTVTVVNSSEQPIYDAEIRWPPGTAGPGEPDAERLGIVMPGGTESKTRSFPSGADMDVSVAVVRFTDASSVRWLRQPDGFLDEFHQA